MKRLAIFIAIFALGLVAHAAPYLGDFAEDATVHFIWSTNGADGASITRSTDGTISVYKANGTTQSTAGITDTEDFDGVTGQHACTIDLSADAFYATGANYTVVITGAVVDTKTVNAVLAHFSIENRFAEVNVTQIEGSDATDTIDARTLPSASYYDPASDTVTVGTNNDKTGYALTQSFPSNFADLAITASTGRVTVGTNADKTGYALSSPQAFDLTGNITGNLSGSVGSVTGAVGSVTGNVGGNVAGSVGSVTGAVGSVTAGVTVTTNNDKTSYTLTNADKLIIADLIWEELIAEHQAAGSAGAALAGATAPTAADNADAVWDEALAGHAVAGSAGAALSSAGAAADPLASAVPGSYVAGTAGYLIGTYIDAAISDAGSAEDVWNYTIGNVTTAGTAGKRLADFLSGATSASVLTVNASLGNKMYVGSVGHVITFELGETVTGATAEIRVKRPDGTRVTWTATVSTTSISYTTVAGDLPQAGVYVMQPYVSLSGVSELKQARSVRVYAAFEE